MKTSLQLWVAAVMIGGPQLTAICQQIPQTKKPASQAVTKTTDQQTDFLSEVSALSILEVELGKMALKKAVAAQVQEFAKMMIDDHTNVKTDLSTLAASKKMTLPAGLPERYQKIMAALAAKSGQEFDRDYLAAVATEHQKEVELIKNASENGRDAEIRAFAAKALPRMLYHTEMVERLKKSTSD